MFVDIAKVNIMAGNGGRGAVNFRREKYIDKGGPDGGDGGKGGDVIFVGDGNTNTLVSFRYNPKLKAEHGQAGTERNKHGRSGLDLTVKVPLGTLVYRNAELLADITDDGQKVVVARGGSGGYGNAHFKSSVRQSPRVAEIGESGEAFEAKLELKLIADIGVIGFPNAGKSTFLSVVSQARPEIADYAFTTLTPNLGVVDIDESGLLIADIPGLIDGASQGKGLGDDFLRHIERTPVLLHLIDAYQNDVAASYKTIRQELAAYSTDLTARPEIVALTKVEGLDSEIINDQIQKLRAATAAKTPLLAISASAKIGLKELLRALAKQVKAARSKLAQPQPVDATGNTIPTISLPTSKQTKAWQVSKKADVFVIKGPRIEKFATRTDFDNPHSLNRLRDIMRKMGITHQLERQGASSDDTVQIGGQAFSLVEQ